MKKYSSKILAALGLALAISPLAQADTIFGVYAGAGAWNADPSGKAGKPSVTLKDLGAKEHTQNNYYIAIEHPIPLLPNVRLEHTDLSSSQTGTVTQSFTIDGTTFTANQSVASKIDLTHTDATLYYEILDNWVNFDLGVTARKFDGSVAATAASTNTNKKVKVDETLPLLYGKLQFDLPFTGLSVGVEGNYVSYQDSKLSDYRAKLSYLYDSFMDLGVELGYRQMSLTVDKSDLKGDMSFKGPYASVIAHF